MVSQANTASNANIAPVNLLSIPKEVLTQICLLVDRESAISLSLVCRHLHSPAEHAIWRELNIFLNPHHGSYVLVQPYGRSGHGPHVSWAQAEALRAENRHRDALRERVNELIMGLGKRRLGYVEKASIIPRPGALMGILQLLDLLSPTLKALEINAPLKHVFETEWTPKTYDTLDIRFIGCGVVFRSLTHLRIGKGAIRHVEFLLLLVQAAPSLTDLDADIDHRMEAGKWDAQMVPSYSPDVGDTEIRRLRLCFRDRTGAPQGASHPIISVIESSLCLQQLALHYNGSQITVASQLMDALDDKADLTDLDWSVTPKRFSELASTLQYGLPSLRRLVLHVPAHNADPYIELFESGLADFSELETICIVCNSEDNLRDTATTDFPEPAACIGMLPSFASTLRSLPKFTAINPIAKASLPADSCIFQHLDALELSAKPVGFVRSFSSSYEGDELLHARLYMHSFELSDVPLPVGPLPLVYHPKKQVQYTASDGSERLKTFEWRAEGSWVNLTDLSGHAVRLEVLKKMRQTEGIAVGEWEGRDMEVGKKAWKHASHFIKWKEAGGKVEAEPEAGVFVDVDEVEQSSEEEY